MTIEEAFAAARKSLPEGCEISRISASLSNGGWTAVVQAIRYSEPGRPGTYWQSAALTMWTTPERALIDALTSMSDLLL